MDSNRIHGYIFATTEDVEFANAKIGDSVVKAEKIPPCFVVDHFIHKKILTCWPGKLYKVKVLNETDEAEKEINKGLVKTYGIPEHTESR